MKDLTSKKIVAGVLSSVLCAGTPAVLANPLGGLLVVTRPRPSEGCWAEVKRDGDKDGGGNANPLGIDRGLKG